MTEQSPEELQADIEVQREQLAGTLDALTAKLDVKSQTQAKVADAKATTQAKVADLKDRATTADGRPRPEVLALGVTVVVVAAVIVWWRQR